MVFDISFTARFDPLTLYLLVFSISSVCIVNVFALFLKLLLLSLSSEDRLLSLGPPSVGRSGV